MKKTITTLVMVMALISLAASVAMAGPESDKLPGDMHQCCIDAAKAGKGCCGKDADAVKAAFAVHESAEAVKADMHKCCAEALTKDKGCCGHSAEELRADYTKKVEAHYAAATTKGKTGCAAAAGCVKSCGAAAKAGGCGAKGTKEDVKAASDSEKKDRTDKS